MSVSYTEPALCHYDYDLIKAWFVYFTVTDDETGESFPKQFRGGINYCHDLQDRLRKGDDLRKLWKSKLKAGWSPLEQAEDEESGKLSLPKALDFALSKCKPRLASKSYSGYLGTVNFIKDAATALKLHNRPIAAVKRRNVKQLLEKAKEDRNWSNHAYNKNLTYLGSIVEQLVEWDIIEYNPAHKIKKLPVAESNKFEAITNEEKQLLHEHLFKNHFRYYVTTMITYHTGIRPKEVLLLKIEDITADYDYINILPDLNEENSKTKSTRKVPVNNYLKEYLRALELEKYPKDYYIFGSCYVGFKGNKGGRLGARHPDYFKPSPQKIRRETTTRFWRNIVKEKLGIQKYQYAMKHTGADDKILAGIPLEALKVL
jgi:integrase